MVKLCSSLCKSSGLDKRESRKSSSISPLANTSAAVNFLSLVGEEEEEEEEEEFFFFPEFDLDGFDFDFCCALVRSAWTREEAADAATFLRLPVPTFDAGFFLFFGGIFCLFVVCTHQ